MYCKECNHLSITEKDQDIYYKENGSPRPEHRCNLYEVRVVHAFHHPEILKCTECVVQYDI